MFEVPTPVEDLSDLYENAPCGYVSMLPDGRIFKANRTLSTWTGNTPEQLLGMRFQNLLTIGTRILYETNFAPLLGMPGHFDEVSLDLKSANGMPLPISASGRVIDAIAEAPAFVRITLFKAMHRRLYERQLVEAKEKSQDLECVTQELLLAERETAELREQFIAVLGHDLRNPLASISGGVRMLAKDQLPERRIVLLGMIESSVQRMAGLIDNVLDFARGRLGDGIPLELHRDVALAPVLEHVVAELRASTDRAIEASFDLPSPIVCDASRIGQLVSNLLGNALSHGSSAAPVRIRAELAASELTIWIANSGVPIPDAKIGRLFQPFFRGDIRSSAQGLGLGLHIASEIAKAHGGAITVTSSLEETRFTFRMPLKGSEA